MGDDMAPPVTRPPRSPPLLAIGVVGMFVAQQALAVAGDVLVAASIVDIEVLPLGLQSDVGALSATLALRLPLDVGILIAWSSLMRWLVRRWVARA
jgi:hypothetical protein